MRVLVIGGYGTFGGRLVDLLLDEGRLTLIVAGRNLGAAEAFCARRKGAATLEAMQFDRARAAEGIAAARPDIVVDAAGPFQLYGNDPYAAVRAALAAGAHWIDLADGVGFVTGISILDAEARAKGRFVLAGASSFPVLSAGVVRRLAKGIDVETIAAGIAPSPFAGVGLNVIRAIASYAGQPVKILAEGRKQVRYGMISSRTMTVSVPGKVPLWPIRFALVEVPDLEALPEEWPNARDIWVGAGPTPALLHRLLWLAAWLVRLRVLRSLVPLAPIMDRVVNRVRWGEHRGGMIVEVTGNGVTRSWHMLAEGDAGPLIPSMAIEAVIRKCLAGEVPEPGARPAHHALELADYEAMFARRGISTGIREARGGPLYRRIAGEAFAKLPPAVQALHAFTGRAQYEGRAEIKGAANPLAALVAAVFAFPRAGKDVPVHVELEDRNGTEVWIRTFGGHKLRSTQAAGRGRYDGLIVERFGPTAFGMAVVVEEGRLALVLRRWDILGVPLPRLPMPRVAASEHADDGRFHFSVDIGLPLLGRLVRYEGWLVSSDPARRP
jgi:hypothetical protein